MGILSNFKDRFNKAEFTIAPNKKLKTISKEFMENFDLTLVFYKGAQIADGDLTMNQLNGKTTATIKTSDAEVQIKGSTKVGETEKIFKENFGTTVQIKDKTGKILVPNEITLGKAAREEYK